MIQIFKQDNIYQTERLKVRRLKKEDFTVFHVMQSDPEVMKYVAKRPNTEEENRTDLEDVINKYSYKENEFWVWAIENIETKELIGTIALIKDKEDNWELGYRFPRKNWGQGYATEVVTGFINWCETITDIQNLVAYVDRRNVASQKVLSKCGFVNLGISYNEEEDCEDYIYSISTT